MRISPLLFLVGFVVPSGLTAQVSTAFEHNIYFPQFSDPLETDSLYGSKPNQQMGSGMINLGPWVDTKYNEILIGGLPGAENESSSVRSPNYDIHKLVKRKSTLQEFGTVIAKGHFRNTYQLDLLVKISNVSQLRIYWADDSGFYDESIFTELRSRKVGSLGAQIGGLFPHFVDELTGDSLDDIVADIQVSNIEPLKDTGFLAMFDGKDLYRPGDTAFPTMTIESSVNRQIFYADFRGTGRKDIIAWHWKPGAFFFFKNDPPFSLQNLLRSMTEDTLLTAWQNPQFDNSVNGLFGQFMMRALPRPSWDNSVDWMPILSAHDTRKYGIFIFRGGPDFGSKRLYIDDAELVIRHPGRIDPLNFQSTGWPFNLADCGDMTGTGNPVLHVGGGELETSFSFFYVLGKAANELADIYQVNNNDGRAKVDTITANGDRLQDVILGMPSYVSDEDLEEHGFIAKGSIQIIYGSKKIPVNLNPKYAVLSKESKQKGIEVVCSDHMIQLNFRWGSSEEALLRLYSVLGVVVYEERVQLIPDQNSITLSTEGLSQGTHLLEIRSASESVTGSFQNL